MGNETTTQRWRSIPAVPTLARGVSVAGAGATTPASSAVPTGTRARPRAGTGAWVSGLSEFRIDREPSPASDSSSGQGNEAGHLCNDLSRDLPPLNFLCAVILRVRLVGLWQDTTWKFDSLTSFSNQ